MRAASPQTIYIRNLPASLTAQEMLDRARQAGFKTATLQQIKTVRYKKKVPSVLAPTVAVRQLTVQPIKPETSAETELRRLITKYGTDLTRHVLEQVEASNAA